MIRLTSDSRIMLAVDAVDFRKQIDSLVRLCKDTLAQDPRSGTYFVFINRSRTMIRLLSYDGNGYWLCTKRLSQGRYTGWPNGGQLTSVTAQSLWSLLKTACMTDQVIIP